ncbi:MAG TPA: hypothetical protein VHE55_04925 [Fimbriimonadaceae bacterium]|nr:hypothetical protein [Fimbriimonadaceae bacterium]
MKSLVILAIVFAASPVLADNAALTTGGQPTMMSGHKSISMESEVVKITVHWNRVDADCLFVFANHGRACTVNMGFPDFGLWAYEFRKKEPHSIFKTYRSYVDGKKVKTKLVLDKDKIQQWQTKMISFAANGKRTVREVYSTELGGAAVDQGKVWAFASYLVHTGASWKGKIGKATVIVTFDPDTELKTPIIMSYGSMIGMKPEDIGKRIEIPGGIVVSGLTKPAVQGRTLTFVLKDWKPVMADDLYVGFKYPDKALQEAKKKKAGGN